MYRSNLDEFYRGRADSRPGEHGVHELGVLDLVLYVHVLVERELAREAHVDDHSRGPHVQRAVKPLLLQHGRVEHLGREVGGSAHNGLAEGLLANDAGIAKVAKLHLLVCNTDASDILCVAKSMAAANRMMYETLRRKLLAQ